MDRDELIDFYKDFYKLDCVPDVVQKSFYMYDDDIFVASLFDQDFVDQYIIEDKIKNLHLQYYDKSSLSTVYAIPFLQKAECLSVNVLRLINYQRYVHPSSIDSLDVEKMQFVFGADPVLFQKMLKMYELYTNESYKVINKLPKKREHKLSAYVIVGVPNSGKSTLAKKIVEQNSQIPTRIVDSDIFIQRYADEHHLSFNQAYDELTEKNLWVPVVDIPFNNEISRAISNGENIVICRTGLSKKNRDRILERIDKSYNIRMSVLLLSLPKALEVNQKRTDRTLPEEKILQFANRTNIPRPYEYDGSLYISVDYEPVRTLSLTPEVEKNHASMER